MKKSILVMGIVVLLLAACAGMPDAGGEDNGGTEVRLLDQDEAYQNMQDDPSILLLDVRTEAEYQEQRIPGALLIPVEELKDRALEELADRDQTIYVICRTGRRSNEGTRILMDLGYTNAFDIGGIVTWPYETETGAQDGNV